MEKDESLLKEESAFPMSQKELQTMEENLKSKVQNCLLQLTLLLRLFEFLQLSGLVTLCRLAPDSSFPLCAVWLHVYVFLPPLSFSRNVASRQTLICPDSSAHLSALHWHPESSLIKVPWALLVWLIAYKLINRLDVFNCFLRLVWGVLVCDYKGKFTTAI